MAGKIALAINALLIIAVIVLFTRGDQQQATQDDGGQAITSEPQSNDQGQALRIAYIKEDSILANYEYVKIEGKKLEQRAQQKGNQFQREMAEYQEEAAKWEQLLAKEQSQELLQMAMSELGGKEKRLNDMQNEMDRMQMDFSSDLTERVQSYLKIFAAENGLDLVLNDAQVGSSILYSSGTLDVTDAVVDGLNAEYAAETAANEAE